MGAIYGAVSAYTVLSAEFSPVDGVVRVGKALVFYVKFCILLLAF